MAGLVRRAAAMEAAMWRSAAIWASRRPVPRAEGDEPFGYLGVVKPILGVFFGLSVVEVPILDLIVRNVVPWEPARWIALALSVWGLLWMIGLYASLKIHPHLVGDAGIRVRNGATIDFLVPWADVESVRRSYRSLPSSRSVQIEDGVLHIAVGSQTSVDVRLRRPAAVPLPAGPSDPVSEVRLYADDPNALVRRARALTGPPPVS